METHFLAGLLVLLIGFGIYWVVYSLVLLVLMKMQGWNVSMLALLGSTALATALAQVPFAGPALATIALAICIWKASGSDFTDSIFSVVIAGALMFAFKLFLLTALMGEIPLARFQDEEEVTDAAGVIQVAPASAWSGPERGDEALLYLKGITLSSNQHMVLVGSGTANYAFTNGEAATIPSAKGRLAVVCEVIRTNEVIMNVRLKDKNYRLTLVPPE